MTNKNVFKILRKFGSMGQQIRCAMQKENDAEDSVSSLSNYEDTIHKTQENLIWCSNMSVFLHHV